MTIRYIWMALASLLFVVASCNKIANNIVIKELFSPSSNYMAVAFIRDSGGEDFSINVSILKAGEILPGEMGNVFCGTNSSTIDVLWQDNSNLIIRHTLRTNEFVLRQREFQNIEIFYENFNEILEHTE